jgi:hypothetical protein
MIDAKEIEPPRFSAGKEIPGPVTRMGEQLLLGREIQVGAW